MNGRARLTRHEHELGEWERARRVPDARLTGVLTRELLGVQHARAQFGAWLEPPRPELTLMIDLDGSLSADGRVLPDAWFGGLDDRPTIVGFGDTYGSIDLKLTPLGAYRLAGVPLSELTGACVSLPDVFGAAGGELGRRPLPLIQDRSRSPPYRAMGNRSPQRGADMAAELRPNIFPAVRYRDADAAVTFLKRAFGATEKAVYRGDDGIIHHAELFLGAGLVMVGQYAPEGWLGGDPPRPLASTVSIYIVIDDPDRHRAVAGGADATIVRELEDMDYGSREYSARDPEGNLWSFGTYDPYAAG